VVLSSASLYHSKVSKSRKIPPLQGWPDPSSTPDEAEQGQCRYVYTRRTQPSMTRRTKTTLIDREGHSVPGPTEAEEQERQP
jgi:hypothetical protein